jgi:phosphoadenosine phosphosulfate reductase
MNRINGNIAVENNLPVDAPPETILRWVYENHRNDLAMMTSLQVTGMVILDMLQKEKMDIPVYFIDTGYHFNETIRFREQVEERYRKKFITVKPEHSREKFEKIYGKELYNHDPDFCCQKNKIEPQQLAIEKSGLHYWISGIRRDQSLSRSRYEAIMKDDQQRFRVHPLINWTWNDVWDYVNKNGVLIHPLYHFGYSSIGCSPEACTSIGNRDQGERSGRWKNSAKTECGLHQKLSVSVDITSLYGSLSGKSLKII